MATPPRKRRPSSALHTLSPAAERALQCVERNPRLQNLEELLSQLRRAEPFAFRDAPPPSNTAVCTDRAARVELLAERAAEGVNLFDAGEVVHLEPESRRSGRHHRKQRRRPT